MQDRLREHSDTPVILDETYLSRVDWLVYTPFLKPSMFFRLSSRLEIFSGLFIRPSCTLRLLSVNLYGVNAAHTAGICPGECLADTLLSCCESASTLEESSQASSTDF